MSRTHPSATAVQRGSIRVDDGRLPTTAGQIPADGCARDFQSIHDAYRPRVLRYLARLAGQSDAEDLTQTVLFRVSEGLPHFRGESSLSTWIYRIATNTALDHLRRAKNEATDEPQHPPDQTNDDHGFEGGSAALEGQTPSVEAGAIRAEMNTCIREFIERLPGNYKTVMVLSELEGFRNGEIAAVLGLSLDTVKIRLHRAREKLRNEMESGCSFSRDERGELACDRSPVAISLPVRAASCNSR